MNICVCVCVGCTNTFPCVYTHVYLTSISGPFFSKLEAFQPSSRPHHFFFSPRQASSLHRPGAVSTHASPPRRLWLQPTIWLQLPGEGQKGFPKLEDGLFVLEGRGGLGRAHKKIGSRILATQKGLWCRMFWGQLFLHVAWCFILFHPCS